MSNVIW